ncbi:MAG: hypothetical protein HRU03_03530, partial [Nanoarchaeales archaeon]|nr:hypothetical protein [Nanoarchaeales archaeon]
MFGLLKHNEKKINFELSLNLEKIELKNTRDTITKNYAIFKSIFTDIYFKDDFFPNNIFPINVYIKPSLTDDNTYFEFTKPDK